MKCNFVVVTSDFVRGTYRTHKSVVKCQGLFGQDRRVGDHACRTPKHVLKCKFVGALDRCSAEIVPVGCTNVYGEMRPCFGDEESSVEIMRVGAR